MVSLAGPAVQQSPADPHAAGRQHRSNWSKANSTEGENRVISGSVLSGRTAEGPLAFLGRYHLQISVLAEGRQRELFGWMHARLRQVLGQATCSPRSLLPSKRFALTTATHGGRRAIVPIGTTRRSCRWTSCPRSCCGRWRSTTSSRPKRSGCLELDEEDLALCTFVCPGKGDYGAMLRRNLTIIEKEG